MGSFRKSILATVPVPTERHLPGICRSDGALWFYVVRFYKDAAPTALPAHPPLDQFGAGGFRMVRGRESVAHAQGGVESGQAVCLGVIEREKSRHASTPQGNGRRELSANSLHRVGK